MQLRFVLDPNETHQKVKDVLAARIPLSGRIRKWLRYHGNLKIDGLPVQYNALVPEGSHILSLVIDETVQSPVPDILKPEYEDDCLMVVWKPAGLPVHESRKDREHSLCRRVCRYLGMSEAYPIGRLDQEVSGFMVFAKNHLAASLLEYQKEHQKIQKRYLALCHGKWNQTEGIIDKPIKKTEVFNRYEVSPAGKPALSRFRVLENHDECSLVEVSIETGRTHQIRLHLQSMEHPILGDQYYGLKDGIPCCQLSACQLTLEHPLTKEMLRFERNDPFDSLPAFS